MTDRKIQRCARLLAKYTGQTYMQSLNQTSADDVLVFPQGQAMSLGVCSDLQTRALQNQIQWLLKNQYSPQAVEQEFDWTQCAMALGITVERSKLLSSKWTALLLARRDAINAGFVENGFGPLQALLDDSNNKEISFDVGTQTLEANGHSQTLPWSLAESVQFVAHLLAVHFVALRKRDSNVRYFYTPDAQWLVYVTHSIQTPQSGSGGYMMDTVLQRLLEGEDPELFAKTKVEFRRMPAQNKGLPNYVLTNALLAVAEEIEEQVLTVEQYKRHRLWLRLPSAQTIVQRFGSWDTALDQAGLPTEGYELGKRSSNDYLLQSVVRVADMLGTTVLSSHMYDEHRALNPQMCLPSSSVIRKWVGRWKDVVAMAGLEYPERRIQQ